ncbi:MAG: DUF3336 domain-containing protein [Nevskiaceae bacterium]|nr:MAG: DUF3336 domain-containing protein [Nevskiaceae bacterium]TBR71339.1 MAG: DUF3336 domain-containing protein [Nevskiaceae bacterium]
MPSKAITARRRDLAHAVNYETWKDIALELDALEGGAAWCEDDTSSDYDFLLIRERLEQLRELRTAGAVRPLVFELVAGLHGNLGNMANPALYQHCRFGTKQLITDYTEEVARCLDYVCLGEFPDFTDADKVVFFKRAGHSFGRSALLLSGGATLGMFHIGVVKALWEHDLLPRVLTGSSAGSIISAMAATRNDAEMPALFDADTVSLEAFRRVSLREAMSSGSLLDPVQLEQCIASNVPDVTFLDAFEHTRRIFGITVSPAEPNQHMRLLNYLTAPHVLIHTAVLASCAVPGIFPPVALRALDFSGQNMAYANSRKWVDGSVSNDLPLHRLARMHNINHYIVSQTNPHVVPFIHGQRTRTRRGLLPYARELAVTLGRDTLDVTRQHLGPTGIFGAAHLLDRANQIMQQQYFGDVTIYPHQTSRQLLHLFSNLTPFELRRFIRDGERATWPQMERIRLQTRISRAFENALVWLKQRGAFDAAGLGRTPSGRTADSDKALGSDPAARTSRGNTG